MATKLYQMTPKEIVAELDKYIIGQDEAIEKLVRSIQRGRMGLKDPNKPIGTFLFVGPTGVGKTYLAKKLVLTECFLQKIVQADFNLHFKLKICLCLNRF
mgnify:CR=1 FL=1